MALSTFSDVVGWPVIALIEQEPHYVGDYFGVQPIDRTECVLRGRDPGGCTKKASLQFNQL